MGTLHNIYCDESCHLEHDHQKVMVLGALACPADKVRDASLAIKAIKQKHGLANTLEDKWAKVSPAKVDLYLEMLDYFFGNPALSFRALIVPDKDILDHAAFGQTHEDWYYKMYFDLLKVILDPDNTYRIYVDIKDTRGGTKVRKLHEVLCNNAYDFSRSILENIQIVHSHELNLLQLADLLIGAISHLNRGLAGSPAKQAFIRRFQEKAKLTLTQTTLPGAEKVNILCWKGQEAQD